VAEDEELVLYSGLFQAAVVTQREARMVKRLPGAAGFSMWMSVRKVPMSDTISPVAESHVTKSLRRGSIYCQRASLPSVPDTPRGP
jgi:hypothetical protein